MKARGYTLIEVMVVVAIIGIVASIAYPSYQGYLTDTYRSNAAGDLQVCALSLERHYSNGFTYVGADTNNVCNLNSPTEGQVRYNISYLSLTQTGYQIRATPVGEVCGSDNCIELDQTGAQTIN